MPPYASSRPPHAFQHEQPREPPQAGAERGAHGKLLAARSEPSELQVRDVGARDQQHGQHETLQHEQPLLEIADHVIAHGLRANRKARGLDESGRVAALELDLAERDRVELGAQRRQRAPRPQAPDTLHVAFEPFEALVVGRRLAEPVGERDPGVGAAIRETESFRHDAHNAEEVAVEPHVLTDDVRASAVARSPEPVTEHDHPMVAWHGVIFRECGSDGRRHAQHGKQRRRRARHRDLLGWLALNAATRRREDRGRLERRRLAPCQEAVHVGAAVVDAHLRRAAVEGHDAVVRKRHRPQQVAVENAEHRRVGADREREDDDGENRGGRAFGERA